MAGEGSVRIDKWLWSVRIYKTRSMASDACKAGKVRMDGMVAKASREVKEGDEIEINLSPLVKKVRVKTLLKNRVGAKLVPDYMEDLTPQEDYDRVALVQKANAEWRDRGTGRPTKKDRRQIDDLKGVQPF